MEDRTTKRIPYNEKVLINNSLEVLANDLSEGGLFVHLHRALLPGSTVTVTFPESSLTVKAIVQGVPDTGGIGLMFSDLTPAQTEKLEEILRQAEAINAIKKTKPTVLMVEDSESVRRLNKSRLTTEGFNVIEAPDGATALKILSTQQPEVILLDLHMEQMDGYKVLGFLKQSPKLRDIPVIVFSSKFSAEEQTRVFEAGADEFLPKMTTPPAKLVSIIKKLSERK